MSGRGDDDELVTRVRQALERASRELDPATAGRLRAARRTALAAARGRGSPAWSSRAWLAAGVAAGVTAAVALAVLLQRGPAPDPGTAHLAAVEDLELITQGEGLDLYEDLEFYQWLAEQDAHAG